MLHGDLSRCSSFASRTPPWVSEPEDPEDLAEYYAWQARERKRAREMVTVETVAEVKQCFADGHRKLDNQPGDFRWCPVCHKYNRCA